MSMSTAENRGLTSDRRAMIVDKDGVFLTQRSHKVLARISARVAGSGIVLKFADKTINVDWGDQRKTCTVWNDRVDLVVAGHGVNAALSEFMGQNVALVSMDNRSIRKTSGTWANSNNSLSDGYPLLIANTASINALSKLAGIPLKMAQFRPNIVVDGSEPWTEDSWRTLKIGELEIELVKPCTRCQITTLNTKNGNIEFPETMEALIKHRRSADPRVKGVLFGWNAIIKKAGNIRVGDPVKVLSTQNSWPTH